MRKAHRQKSAVPGYLLGGGIIVFEVKRCLVTAGNADSHKSGDRVGDRLSNPKRATHYSPLRLTRLRCPFGAQASVARTCCVGPRPLIANIRHRRGGYERPRTSKPGPRYPLLEGFIYITDLLRKC